MAVKTLSTGIKDMATTPGRYPNIPVTALALDLTFEAPSVAADGVNFTATGKEIVLIRNTAGAPGTFTVASQRDEYGRTGDITTYAIAANTVCVLPLGAEKLFKTTADNLMLITMSATTIEVAVLRLPNSV